MPVYYIATRDSFAYDLIEKITYPVLNGRIVKRIDYYFDLNNLPANFKTFLKQWPNGEVGVTAYHNFFSHKELKEIEDKCFETEQKAFKRHYLPMTSQVTCSGEKIRRTKFFFGYRYIWTRV